MAILAKDKAHCLPRYLKCLESQTWPKTRTLIYIRTNNNNDATKEMLYAWVNEQRRRATEKIGEQYVSIHIDSSEVETKVQQWTPHTWNATRFKVLGAIRRASVEYAMRQGAHYFVIDCDNFVVPCTLEAMCESGCDAIAPLLSSSRYYTNMHFKADKNGYMDRQWADTAMAELNLRGLVECDVIHCTYFLSYDVLKHAIYDDGTSRYEYAILADQLRKANVAQYMDNRVDYGRLTFADDLKTLEAEPWIGLFPLDSVAPIKPELAAPRGLAVTYGGARTLRMDVTQKCCNLFLSDNTIVIPEGCNLNAQFGDPRFRVSKTLEITLHGTLLASINESPSSETRVVLGNVDRTTSSLSSSSSTSLSLPSTPAHSNEPARHDTVLRSSDLEPRMSSFEPANANDKWLIISPQAGFGNRLRAMCSGILLAKKLGRKPMHAWLPEREEEVMKHTRVEHLQQTRMRHWTDYFVASEKLPAIDDNVLRRECKTIKCYTEWLPGDFWYPAQSRCQRHLAALGIAIEPIRTREDVTTLAGQTKTLDDKYIMLETSLSVRYSKQRSKSNVSGNESKSEAESEEQTKQSFERKLSSVYRKYFAPNKIFSDILATLTNVATGISVRRGEFLHYVSAANVSQDALVTKLIPVISSRPYVLFSDDYVFRDQLLAKIRGETYFAPLTLTASISEQWRRAYIEFLTLAFKCDTIYGTASSSFAIEAALFGNKPYVAL